MAIPVSRVVLSTVEAFIFAFVEGIERILSTVFKGNLAGNARYFILDLLNDKRVRLDSWLEPARYKRLIGRLGNNHA